MGGSDSSNPPLEDNSNRKVFFTFIIPAPFKVPPLRILLPKTPSEEDPTVELVDTSRKPRPAKPTSKSDKNDELTNTQRMTRSKVRQKGITLDEVPWGSKRKGNWRRGSNASSASNAAAKAAKSATVPSVAVPAIEAVEPSNTIENEQSQSPAISSAIMDEASRSSVGAESEKGTEVAAHSTPSPTMALFTKNPYESFYELRAMVSSAARFRAANYSKIQKHNTKSIFRSKIVG